MKRPLLVAALGLLLFAAGVLTTFQVQPGIGTMTVVGKTFGPTDACVRYRAFGKTEETCIPPSISLDCINDAKIGQPLPKPCF